MAEAHATILLVDDDPTTQGLLKTRLEGFGSRVVLVANQKQAQRALAAADFGVVLCNWNNRNLDADQICEEIRQLPGYRYIIAYSSSTEPIRFGACRIADDILDEPANLVQLQMRLLAAGKTLELQKALAEQAEAYKALSTKLDQAYRTLHSELQAASELQLSLLPTVSDVHPGFCLDWMVLPSRYLAGDNLNYFMMQGRYLIFYHLDVAGHGVASALLSVTLNQLLSPQPGSPMVRFDPNLELKRIVPPVDVVSELNRRFQPQGDGYFTMIYAVLDTETSEVRFCQAGHPSAIKIDRLGNARTVGDGGFPVGLWPGMTYEETTTHLEPGDRMILYSDGIMACVNQQGEPYSLDRLADIIKANSGAPLKKALCALEADLKNWCRQTEFADDISVLVLEAK